jgi:hypothetical protein
MELRTLHFKKKYVNLLIKYIHFDEYGSEFYDEEVKRIEQVLENYEPMWYSLKELVQIIRTVFRDNDENYLYINMYNDHQEYEVSFYGENLGKFDHNLKDYQASYDAGVFSISTPELESTDRLIDKAKKDVELIAELKNVRPFKFDADMAKCSELYQTFFDRKIDMANPNVEEELAYMLFLLKQYEMAGVRDQYYTFGNKSVEPSLGLKNVVLKLKSIVNLEENEEKLAKESINDYVRSGVKDIGEAIAVHFEHRTPEEQLQYLKKLCSTIAGYSQTPGLTRTLSKNDKK